MMHSMKIIVPFLCTLLIFPISGFAQDFSRQEILEELRDMKERIERLEDEVRKKDQEIEELKDDLSRSKAGEEEMASEPGEEPLVEKWYDKVELSGVLEVEFSNDHSEFKDNTDPDLPSDKSQEHDVTLATAELGLDAQVNKYTQAHILFLYEEDEDEDRVRLDEGTIQVGGIPKTYGLYARAGKYYPHFGELNTYLVSDPLTLEIFEIRETAAEAGWENQWLSVGAGVFNGDVQEDFHSENNRIHGFFGDLCFHTPEGSLGDLSLTAGASYLSSVADTDTLEGEVVDINGDGDTNDIEDYVDGVASYLVAEYGMFSLGAEYITALEDFRPGEMLYAVDRNGTFRETRPAAWNMEFAVMPFPGVQVAARYEGSNEMYDLFPEDQYGGSVSWEVWKYLTLSAEYLHGEYEDSNTAVDRDRDVVTVQAAAEF